MVEEDRVDHLRHRCGRRVERGPCLQELHHLGATVAGALNDLLEAHRVDLLRDGNAGDVRVAGHRDHRVTVTAEDEPRDVAYRHAELPREEGAKARGVEDPGHSDHVWGWKAGDLKRHVAHGVQRIRNDDDDRIR